MYEDAHISSYLFWKLSIIIATLDKIYDLLNAESRETELDLDDKAYINSAKMILKSAEVSLQSIKDIIDSLKTPTAKNYFYNLYNSAKEKLDLILETLSKQK